MFTFEDARNSLKGHGSVLPKMTHYRGKFLSKYPWFASLVMRLELVEDTTLPYAGATDGVHLYYNSSHPDMQSDEDAYTTFAHECGHCFLGHCDPQRRGDRDPYMWNIAADYVVNGMIAAEGFKLVPTDPYNPDFIGLSTEEVYRIISVDPKHQAMAKRMREQNSVDVLPYPKEAKPSASSSTPVDHQKLRDAWTKAAIQAAEARAAHAAGNTPGGLCEQVQTNLAPAADYISLLAEYLSACVTDDITWAVPNRRYFPHGIYKPSATGDGISHLILGIDCSGSVYTEMLSTFVSQIAALLAAYPIERLDVYIVDTVVQAKYEYVDLDDLPRIAQVTGRGGTDFECVFEDMKTQHAPDLMMFFTDFDCSMPPSARDTPYPVLWMVPQECLRHTRQNYDPRCGVLIPVQ